jgi:hypothetical protein
MTLMVTTGAPPIVSGGAVMPQSNVGYTSPIYQNTVHTITLVNSLPFTIAANTGYQVLQAPTAASDGETTTVGGTTPSTLVDATKTWTSNQWQGYQVTLLGGAYAGQSAPIASNTTSGTLTLSTVFPTAISPATPYIIGGRAINATQYLASGTTLTANSGVRTLILDGSTTITVTFPALPIDSDEFHVCSSVSVTFTGSATGTVKGASAITIGANSGVAWIYRTSNTTWYRIY